MDEDLPTFSAVVGANLRRWRDAVGVTQDRLAQQMLGAGISWRQPTVAALERGQREISSAELVGLCMVTGEPLATWLESLPGEERTRVGSIAVDLQDLRELVNGGKPGIKGLSPMTMADRLENEAERRLRPEGTSLGAVEAARRWLGPESDTPAARQAIHRGAAGDAEIKLSRSLQRVGYNEHATQWDVAAVAYLLWGHGLTDEREREFERRGWASGDPETDRGRRGHVTRDLGGQIRAYMDESIAADNEVFEDPESPLYGFRPTPIPTEDLDG